MVKVCHMTSAHDSEDVRIFHKECTSLAQYGFDTYLVQRGESYEKKGVHIIGVGFSSGGRISRMTVFAKKVYKTALSLDCDIYHLHDPELLPYGLKLKKKGKRVVFDSHENTLDQIKEKDWIPVFLRKLIYNIFAFYQEHVCKQLDAVVSVTPHICNYFKNFTTKVEMISNFPILCDEYEEPLFKDRKICFAGGINKEHQFPEVLKALENVDNVQFELCGDGEKGFIDNLKTHPSWKKVNFYGKLPHLQIKEIYAKSNLGLAIAPYSFNSGKKLGTLGNTKIYEIMMAGLPFICTDYTLWNEMRIKYNCGICVNPYNTEEIANAINYLLDNPEIATVMGKNGRKAVCEVYNWHVEEEVLFKLYREIIQC